jgi:hypothetical protein
MSTDPNQHVLSYLDYYVSYKDPPRYALLITGAWGAGKTWLVRKYFAANSEHKYYYISLYGAKTADEVAERIFAARHPVLASKGAAIAGRLLKGLVKITTSIDIDGDKAADLQLRSELPDLMDVAAKKPTTNDRTLIFDDLERCAADKNELWGFINMLVEHEGAKVILLSAENELDNKDDSYRRTKEKNIGMTLAVVPDAASVLDSLIAEANGPAASALQASRLRILQLFELSGCTSLRVLRFAVRDFCRIWAEIPSELQEEPAVVAELIDSTLSLALGVHSGELKPDDIVPIPFIAFPEEPTDSALQTVTRRYSSISLGAAIPSLDWWRSFFGRGEIQRTELVAACKRVADKTRIPNWLRLAHFDRLSDQEFEQLIDETWKAMEAHELRSIGEILHVAATHMWAIKMGATRSARTLSTVRDAAVKAITALEDDAVIEFLRPQHGEISLHSHAGIIFAAHDIAEFQEVVQQAQQVCEEAKLASARRAAVRLLASLREGSQAFAAALGISVEEDRLLEPIVLNASVLSEIRAEEFAETLISLDQREQVGVVGALQARLKRHVPKEQEWVKAVAKRVGLQKFLLRVRLEKLTE